jgi:uncharacterized membrane protein
VDGEIESDTMWGCLFAVLGMIFVGFIVFILTVVIPSHENRQSACESHGGVIVQGGACIKKENVVGY